MRAPGSGPTSADEAGLQATVDRYVSEWVEEGSLPEESEIRRIQMGTRYHSSTKLDRDLAFIAELMALGYRRARQFLADRGEPA